MPLPMEPQESAQGTAPSHSSKATVRSKGEGQVAKVTIPAVAPPLSRRLNLVLRLFAHLVLTWAFVEPADPQIVNGLSSWPLWPQSAVTMLLDIKGGHGTTKISPVSCSWSGLARGLGERWCYWLGVLQSKRKAYRTTVVKPKVLL